MPPVEIPLFRRLPDSDHFTWDKRQCCACGFLLDYHRVALRAHGLMHVRRPETITVPGVTVTRQWGYSSARSFVLTYFEDDPNTAALDGRFFTPPAVHTESPAKRRPVRVRPARVRTQ
jgi:hypothetical protein